MTVCLFTVYTGCWHQACPMPSGIFVSWLGTKAHLTFAELPPNSRPWPKFQAFSQHPWIHNCIYCKNLSKQTTNNLIFNLFS